ncbi:MAG: sigma 54-interacting transcriptional regulator, partial [Myxococcota bacterium]
MTDLVEAPFSQDDHTQQELVLVLAWSVEHQERIGEVMVCPEGEAQLLGRSSSKSKGHSEGPPMGVWQRQRPGASEATGPLEDRRLSRRQLVVERQGEALQVTNIGRCPMLYRGIEMGSCTLKPGEAVILQHVAVLLCAVRPSGWDGPWPQGPQPDTSFPFGQADAQGIVGESPACWALRRQLMFMAQRRQHVLLLGASGTGKELAARAVHALSERSEQAWVARNASTIPENLFDAELFGNTRGYPNPGMPERAGLVGEADRGTLFLDELGELPEALQAHLLRLMDRGGEYHRLGEARPRRADVRLLGATNRSEENLKHDLLARFAMRLNLPTLNARREDVPLLAIHMLQRAAAKDPGLVPLIFNAHQERLYPRLTPELVQGLLLHRYTHHAHELDTLLWSSITAVVSNPADHADRQGRVWLHLTEPLRQQLASSDHAAAHDLEMPTQD